MSVTRIPNKKANTTTPPVTVQRQVPDPQQSPQTFNFFSWHRFGADAQIEFAHADFADLGKPDTTHLLAYVSSRYHVQPAQVLTLLKELCTLARVLQADGFISEESLRDALAGKASTGEIA